MNDRDRLDQLRALLVRVERMPTSAERDWMLGEIRGRAVDVETGVKPAAMRALSADGAEPEIPAAPEASRGDAVETVPPAGPTRRPASRRPARVRRASPASLSSPVPARRRAVHESVVDLLEEGGVLCLEEQAAVGDGATRPWAGGLRG